MVEQAVESEDRFNKLAVVALVCAVLLLAPVSIVLAVIALVQIWRRREGGLVVAVMALLISGVFVPGAVVAVAFGEPGRGLDACVASQDTAVGALRMIGHLQQEFHDEHGRYGTLKEVGWGPKVDLRPYTYELVYAREDTFLAVARGSGTLDGDELVIDEKRKVRRVVDKCRR